MRGIRLRISWEGSGGASPRNGTKLDASTEDVTASEAREQVWS